ncbi:hypothetical protein DFA_05001 [Cavenderia fasciculata]|uniref:START domain-containing protein n=1 Tax=Cavenderia fasciculata TaxID=261658 RepID=F4PMX8_CACFS|nr:uncharacterized protein DFA_05001 [Cavenderia fasciculata]EGG22871.1 hypothetical protein DFA_05001 [Cavenderia fasciculata]|eukprot:XP_004360722.1 hypothetical protein DFA_05001 [Cavenderia fasciculata]
MDIIESTLDKYIREIDDHCLGSRIRAAAETLEKLDSYIQSIRANNVNGGDNNTPELSSIESIIDRLYTTNKRINRLRQESKEIDMLLNVLHEDFKSVGWTEINKVDGIHTMYKENGSGMHSIRIDGIVSSPIFNICSVLLEVDLYNTWIPRLTECNLLASDDRFRKVIYCRAECPWPIADRDLCLYGYGVDMLEDKEQTFVVVSRTYEDGDFDHNVVIPPPTGKPSSVVRSHTQISGFTIKPLSPTETYVQVVSCTDPRMKFVPYWFLNFITNQFSHYLFQMLRQQAQKVTTSPEFQKRIASNPIYSVIKEKSELYFKNKELEKEKENEKEQKITATENHLKDYMHG